MLLSGSSASTEVVDFGTNSTCIIPLTTFIYGVGGNFDDSKAIICDYRAGKNQDCFVIALESLETKTKIGSLGHKRSHYEVGITLDIGINRGFWVSSTSKPTEIVALSGVTAHHVISP